MKRRSFLKLSAATVAASPIALNAQTVSTIKSAKEQFRIDSPEIKEANHIYLKALSGSQGFSTNDNSKRDDMIKLLIAYPLRFRATSKPLLSEEEEKSNRWKHAEIMLDNIDARYNKKTRYVEIFLPNETKYKDISKDVLTTIYLATVLKALSRNEAKAFKGLIYEQSKRVSSFIEGLDNKYANILNKNIEEHAENKSIVAEYPSFIEYVEYYRARAIVDSRDIVSTKTMTKEQKLMITSLFEELDTYRDGKYIADMLNMNLEDNVFSALVMQKTYQLYLDNQNYDAKISNAFSLFIQRGLEVSVFDHENTNPEADEVEILAINPLTEDDKLAVSEFKLKSVETHFENIMVFIA